MGKVVIDELVRSRRKTIALIVHSDGRLVVRAPLRTSQKIINEFIESKSDWIEKTKQSQQARRDAIPQHRFEEGELFWYLGQQYSLKIVKSQPVAFQFLSGFSLTEQAQPQGKAWFEGWYRQSGRLLTAKL